MKQDELEYVFLFKLCVLVQTELYTCLLLVMFMVGNSPCLVCFELQAPLPYTINYKM